MSNCFDELPVNTDSKHTGSIFYGHFNIDYLFKAIGTVPSSGHEGDEIV